MKGFTMLTMYVLFLTLFTIILHVSGEVIVNNIPYRILAFIGGYRIGYLVDKFFDWNFEDTSIPQPNDF
jgi:hypothetical protein